MDTPTEQAAQADAPPVLSVTEAARRKECSRQTIYNALAREDLNGLSFRGAGNERKTHYVHLDARFRRWRPAYTGRRVE